MSSEPLAMRANRSTTVRGEKNVRAESIVKSVQRVL